MSKYNVGDIVKISDYPNTEGVIISTDNEISISWNSAVLRRISYADPEAANIKVTGKVSSIKVGDRVMWASEQVKGWRRGTVTSESRFWYNILADDSGNYITVSTEFLYLRSLIKLCDQ